MPRPVIGPRLNGDAVLALARMKCNAILDETLDTEWHADIDTIQAVADTLGVGKTVSVLAADMLRDEREGATS